MKRYTVMLEKDQEDGSFTVTVPSLPGIVTQGASIEEALAMAQDAIRCHINGLAKEGLPVPSEDWPPALLPVQIDEAA